MVEGKKLEFWRTQPPALGDSLNADRSTSSPSPVSSVPNNATPTPTGRAKSATQDSGSTQTGARVPSRLANTPVLSGSVDRASSSQVSDPSGYSSGQPKKTTDFRDMKHKADVAGAMPKKPSVVGATSRVSNEPTTSQSSGQASNPKGGVPAKSSASTRGGKAGGK